ncbi:MAG: L-alanine exporter AlaE [archaeon]|nr:L-alanine exporter AlaE [Nanoarchaeota archaeon]
MSKSIEFLKKNAKKHVIDTTAMLTESNPAFAAFEVGIAGMSDDVSIKSRFVAAGLAFGGLGLIYARGRDLSRRLFKITDQTSEKKQFIHDSLYNALFSACVAPPIYLASGARDWKEIAIATGCSTVFGAVNGIPQGYAVDVYRDLTGIKDCDRRVYPDYIKRQGLRTKRTLATGLAVASIGLMGLIYTATPNNNGPLQEKTAIEQTINYDAHLSLEETLLTGDGK